MQSEKMGSIRIYKMNFLKIRYKSIINCVLWICLLQGMLSDYIGFHQINYICDVLLLVLLLFLVCRGEIRKLDFRRNIECFSINIFVVVVIVGWLFNPASVLKGIWGVRNYGRFFIFYILANYLWDPIDVERIVNLFLKLFPFHIAVIAFQYIVEGLSQDNLSGLFGKTAGGNGGLLIYLAIVLCIIICRFEYKKISTFHFVACLLLILVNAALSELKLLFVLAVLVVVWYLLMSKRKGRGMTLAFFFILAFYIGTQLLYYVFPHWANYFTLDNIMNIISQQEVYASQMDIGRTAVFSKLTPIISNWAGNDALFIGIGLGNGDYSSTFSFLNSAFFIRYELLHYTWLSLGYLFVETGYLGTIAYVSFFVILEVKAILAYQNRNTYFNLLGTFLPYVFMIVLVYDSSLRSNFAYMAFAALTWQTIASRKEQRRRNEDYAFENP